MAKQEKPAKGAKKGDLPESVTLASVYGFIADDELHHHWAEGQVETDPVKIQALLDRKAPLVGVTHE